MSSQKKAPHGVIEPFIGGILILVIAVGVLYMLTTSRKTQVRVSQAEVANQLAARQLEILINKPWLDPNEPASANVLNPDLDPAGNPHKSGLLTWETSIDTTNTPRLITIKVTSYLASKVERSIAESSGTQPTNNPTIAIVGYKFDDF